MGLKKPPETRSEAWTTPVTMVAMIKMVYLGSLFDNVGLSTMSWIMIPYIIKDIGHVIWVLILFEKKLQFYRLFQKI